MSDYLICVDQSTTSTKVFLMDTKGNTKKAISKKHRQLYPQSGWVEHDAMEIYDNMMQGLLEMIASVPQTETIKGLCITNQRETTVLWDKDSGLPLANAIVWQCRRTVDLCEQLKPKESIVKAKTGLKIDPYFSATKMKWLLDHAAIKGHRYMLGTMDSFLLYKLCGIHVSDHTNASRTLLYNLHTCDWDEELLAIFQIPRAALPRILKSDEDFGSVELMGRVIPILSVIGDSQSALYAHGCFTPGDVKITMGTGSSVMMNQGSHISSGQYGVVAALAYQTRSRCAYASEAIINSSGDTMNWLREELGLYETDAYLNQLEMDAHGISIVPAFVGLGIPYWSAKAKACISGISRNTTREDIIIAGIQSIAFQIYDAISALQEDANLLANRISADGGASQNPVLMQFLADLCQREIITFEHSACSALGVYILAMQKLGYPREQLQKVSHIYSPRMELGQREQLLHQWHQAVDMVIYDAKRRM